MSDGLTVQVQGLQQLMADLRKLPDVIQQKVLRGAMGTAAGVIKRRAVELAPEWTGDVANGHPPPGTLKRAIYAARLVDKCSPLQEVWQIGVRSGKKARNTGKVGSKFGPTQGSNRDAFYAVWVEYGHYTRTPKGPGTAKARRASARASGAARWVAPKPFMRPALQQSGQAAIEAFAAYMRSHLPDAQGSVRAFELLRAAA